MTAKMTIKSDGRVGIGSSSPTAQTLEVVGYGIRTQRSGSDSQANAAGTYHTDFVGQWPTVGHQVFRTSGARRLTTGGTRIRVPVAYQTNLNAHWYIKLTGFAANYNSRSSYGFSGEVWGGHLSVFNINHTNVAHTLSSIDGDQNSSGDHYVRFNFSHTYDSNGAYVWWECVCQTQTIYAPNMNGMAFG